HLIELLDEMDIFESKGGREVREEFLCREPEERVFYKGRWYEGLYLHAGESEDDRREFERFQAGLNKWIEWRDAAGKRAFALPVAECSRDEAVISLDKISFGE